MHVALFCPPFPSHVAAMEALGSALRARGARATLIHQSDVAAFVRPDGALDFHPVGLSVRPPGSLRGIIQRAARPGGPLGIRRVVRDMAEGTAMLCAEAPEILRRIGADAVIADQMEPAGGLIADRLGLPFASVAAAVPIDLEDALPLPMLGWGYDPSTRGRKRNAAGLAVADLLMDPLHRTIRDTSEAWGLGLRTRMQDCLSPLLSVWQLTPGLDFPREAAPLHAHGVGALRPARESERRLDLDIRGGRPLVYVSLGTLQSHRLALLKRIARACRRIDAEIVVSHCGRLPREAARQIKAHHVVADLPQSAMIARADLVVTHAGLNTVLDAAEAGVPVVCLPIAFDQPGVAARVEAAGMGRTLNFRIAGEGRIAKAVEDVLSDPTYRINATRIGRELRQAGGAERAADLMIQAFRTGQPAVGVAA